MTDIATLGSLLRLARDTVANPREGATTVLTFAPPRQALWLMLALVVVVTMLLGFVFNLVAPPAPGDVAVQISPVTFGLVQGVLLIVMVHAIHRIGAAFGGTGRFEESLLLVIWLQFIFICIQVLQVLAMLILPVLGPLIFLLSIALFFWLLVNFIAALHGFRSLGQVLVMVILTLIGFALLASIILAILGVQMPQGGV
ncbi:MULTISPECIES: Yip1 family protein [Paracoccaceae]|jgi:hypothetical protein|uniref:Yip1 family protein n=1 Tax=Rhodobacterales TaxID=204455 RepID=UPI001B1E94D4|nr:Yip1 family protein [Boseongicola sp. H5]MBO6921349.1 YIP1 family protein [Roseicyclus sp.]